MREKIKLESSAGITGATHHSSHTIHCIMDQPHDGKQADACRACEYEYARCTN